MPDVSTTHATLFRLQHVYTPVTISGSAQRAIPALESHIRRFRLRSHGLSWNPVRLAILKIAALNSLEPKLAEQVKRSSIE
jgi:hypothetical protein